MAILKLRAMRGWNKTETARHFFVSDNTVRAWLRRADDDSLVDTHTPVNRFPDFVRYAVQQVKLFCPTLGKVKIADKLAWAGVHIGKTTVERILKEHPVAPPDPTSDDAGNRHAPHRWSVSMEIPVRRSRSRSTVTKDGVTCPSYAFIARRDSFGVWDLALPVCTNSGFRGSTAEAFNGQPS